MKISTNGTIVNPKVYSFPDKKTSQPVNICEVLWLDDDGTMIKVNCSQDVDYDKVVEAKGDHGQAVFEVRPSNDDNKPRLVLTGFLVG